MCLCERCILGTQTCVPIHSKIKQFIFIFPTDFQHKTLNNAFYPLGSVRSMTASTLKTARSVVSSQTKQSSSKVNSRGMTALYIYPLAK